MTEKPKVRVEREVKGDMVRQVAEEMASLMREHAAVELLALEEYLETMLMERVLREDIGPEALAYRLRNEMEELMDLALEDLEQLGRESDEEIFVFSLLGDEVRDISLDMSKNASEVSIDHGMQHEVLSKSEEQWLCRVIQMGRRVERFVKDNGDDTPWTRKVRAMALAARDDMVRHNQRLVMSVMRTYRMEVAPDEVGDRFQAGNMGLLKAIDRFDPESGHKFSTFATWWIRQSMTRWSKNGLNLVRLPIHQEDRMGRVVRAQRDLSSASTPASIRKISEMAQVDEETVAELLEFRDKMRGLVELDRPIREGDEATLGEFVFDTRDHFEEQVGGGELAATVAEALSQLPERARNVLMHRFGFVDGRVWTLEEVAQLYGVTRERIRQIEKWAVERLRDPRVAKKLKSFLS